MERRIIYVCSLLLYGTTLITAQNSFIATFPKTISKDLTLPISVHLLKLTNPLTVTAYLQDDANRTLSTIQEVDITPGPLPGNKFVTLALPIPLSVFQMKDFESEEYTLTITGDDGGMVFSESAKVKLSAARPTLQVVTDKNRYHPGDKVHFLAYGRYPDGSIIRNPYDVVIKDSERNRVEQFLNVGDQNGLFSGSFIIPKHSPLGRWEILAKQDDRTQTTNVNINEYELPQFDVQMKVPRNLRNDFSELEVNITARHPDGRGVNGEVNLEVFKKNRGSIKKKALLQDGNATLIINRAELERVFRNLHYLSLQVKSVVEEDVTGEIITESKYTFIEGDYDRTRIEFPREGRVIFKPGIPFETTVKVTDDGEPLLNPASRMNITATSSSSFAYSRPSPAFSTNLYDVPSAGEMDLSFDVPADAKRINIAANYEKAYGSLNAVKAQSPSNNFLKIRRNRQSNTDVLPTSIDVTATEPVDVLYYVIADNDEIVYMGTFDMNRMASGTLPMPTLPEVTSTLTLLAYYVRDDGEVVADLIEIAKGEPKGQKTTLQFENDVADPGSNVRLFANNAKGSFMLLRGTDKRLERQDDDDDRERFLITDGDALKDKYPKDADDAFRKTGHVVLSDANVYRYEPTRKCSNPLPEVEPVFILNAKHGFESSKEIPLVPYNMAQDFLMESPYRHSDDDFWLWRNVTAPNGFDNRTAISLRAPRPLSTWDVTALMIGDYDGDNREGIPKAELKVTLPFYIRTNIPYSVKAGEPFILIATVYNHLNYDAEVLVALGRNDGWYNVVPLLLPNGKSSSSRTSSKVGRLLKIGRGSLGYAVFPIIPREPGDLQVLLTATTQSGDADAITETLRVKPVGIEVKRSWAALIDQTDGQGSVVILDMNDPNVNDEDVTRVVATATGDVISPSISVLDDKVQPIGNARYSSIDTESLVKTLAPNVLLSNYYTTMGFNERVEPDFKQDYERLVSMQLPDGSFSSFGASDIRGSTWMTAMALGIMNDLREKFLIDQTAESQAAQWLVGQQNQDGSFREDGRIVEMALQGGSNRGPLELTAFVLAVLNGVSCLGCADNAIQRATDYLEKEVDSATSPHQLATAAHALQLVGSTKVPEILSRLESKAAVKDGKKYWTNGESVESTWFPKPKQGIDPQDLETATYYLATMLERGETSLPVLRWVLSLQKDDKFNSIDAGVLTTEAKVQLLYLYGAVAEKITTSLTNLNIQTSSQTPGQSFMHTFPISVDNALLLQSVNVPVGVKQLQLNSMGPGVALVEVNRYSSQDVGLPMKDITVTATILDETSSGYTLNLCSRKRKPPKGSGRPEPIVFGGRSPPSEETAIMVVDIPQGMRPNVDTRDLNVMSKIDRHEIDNGKLKLYIYEIEDTDSCIPVQMTFQARTVRSQPSRVTLYELDNPEKKYTTYFESAVRRDTAECERRCGMNCLC